MIKRTLSFIACLVIHSFLISVLARAQTVGLVHTGPSRFQHAGGSIFRFLFSASTQRSHPDGLPPVRRESWKTSRGRSGSRDRRTGEIPETVRLDSEQLNCPRNRPATSMFSLLPFRSRCWNCKPSRCGERTPIVYISGLSYSVFLIMRRNFAPQAERLRSVIARERKIPQVLEAARQNISNPPRVYTEVALQQMPDTIKFFQMMFPKAFRRSKGRQLLAEFKGQQRCGHRSIEQVPEISAEGAAARIQRRFPPGRGEFPQEAAVRRDGGYSPGSPARGRLCGSAAQPAAAQGSCRPD